MSLFRIGTEQVKNVRKYFEKMLSNCVATTEPFFIHKTTQIDSSPIEKYI